MSWHIARPSATSVARYLDAQRSAPFSYPAPGATRERHAPPSFVVDHNRRLLGTGAACFQRAVEGIRAWRMFPAPWTAIEPRDAPIETGQVVAVLVHALGVWWLNAARIVYVHDVESDFVAARSEGTPVQPRRFGFAYGTLPGHAESGEERFSVEWDADDRVYYDLYAFSRPRYWGARVARPLTRALQRRFAHASTAAMLDAVRAGNR